MKDDATPRPWRKDGQAFSATEHTFQIVGGKDGQFPTIFVSSICSTKRDQRQLEANAALIVRAVNAYDDMLAALKVAEKAIDDCLNFRSHLNYDARDVVRAAIAKAEGATR